MADATAQGVSQALSWGLDRIDSRSGRDSKYEYGSATGAGTTVYILDTGVRISHSDLGGRALPGWSSGCPTGSESACGSSYVYQGVITQATPTCHTNLASHGTHCASTVGGSAYGVATGATIVAVQALSCQGFGTSSTVIAAIEWAVADAAKYPNQKSIISMSLGGSKSMAASR